MTDPLLAGFSGSTKAGAPVAACPYASPPEDYCNLDRLLVEVSPPADTLAKQVVDVVRKADPPAAPVNWVLDGHRQSRARANAGRLLNPDLPLQLVVRSARWPARTVTLSAEHSMVCGDRHQGLVVAGPNGQTTHAGRCTLSFVREPWRIDESTFGTLDFAALFAAAWNSLFAEPTRYAVAAASCGVPVPGDDAPATRLLSVPIECFPADSCAVSIEILPFSFSQSDEFKGGIRKTTEERDVDAWMKRDGIEAAESSFGKLVKKWEFSHTDGDRKRKVDFAKLGTLRPAKLLEEVIRFAALLPKLLAAGRVGFFIQADYVACGVSLDAEWGFEEGGQSVRRVFTFSARFTVIRGTVQVGFGYRLPTLCEVSVALALEIDFGLEGAAERKEADQEVVLALRNRKSFSAGLNAVAEAGWLFALEGSASCPFSLDIGVAYHMGAGEFKLDFALDREASTINFKASNGLVGEWGYEYPFLDKKRLIAHP